MATAPYRALTRVSIAWSGNPASEDTDTLVLTIGRYSVDLRMWASGPLRGEIEWGMVGYVAEAPSSTKEKPMLAWDNIIDSRPAPPVESPDEAAFKLLDDGNVLETGKMYNPRSGRAEAYEEVWRREPVSGRYCVLERVGAQGFIGRLGDFTIGAGVVDGVYVAYRDQREGREWKRLYHRDPNGNIPSLPEEIPLEWTIGDQVDLSGQEWTVREVGSL